MALATIAPRVYLPMPDLDQTGLLRQGSMARYKVYFRFPLAANVARIVADIQPDISRLRLGSSTWDAPWMTSTPF